MPRAPKKAALPKARPGVAIIKSGGTRSRPLVQKEDTDVIGSIVKKERPAFKVNVNGRKTKPPYLRMIKEAIRANAANNIHGATLASVANYIRTNFPVNLKGYNARLRVAIARCVDNEQLEKVGPSRYKITKKEREREGRRKARKSKAAKAEADEDDDGAAKKKRKPAKKVKKEGAEDGKAKRKAAPSKKTGAKKATTADGASKKRKAAPKIKRGGASKEGAPAAGASGETKWIWQFKDGQWWNYDWEASDNIEQVYQDYLKNPGHTDVRSVSSGQWDYMVDFRQMKQQNLRHESHTKRDIRRISLPVEECNPNSNPRSKGYPDKI